MTPAEASNVLGVRPGASWDDVRRAYRTLMRSHHPDRAGATHAGAAALITQAFAVLEASRTGVTNAPPQAPPPRTPPAGPVARPTAPWASVGARHVLPADAGPVHLLADDTIGIDASAEEAFLLLLESANDVGEVTYVDPDIGLLETIVAFPGAPATSLVLTLQGRATHVEAFCTVEALEGASPPPLAAVVEVLADLARRRVGQPAPHPVRAPREWLTEAD